jgi:hypothetical protein
MVAVSVADNLPDDDGVPFFERAELAADIESILSGDPDAADVLARLFDSLRQAIDSGLSGINQTREVLVSAVELAYLHSGAHAAAVRLYRLSLAGHLKVKDEPVRLINAAIGRGVRSVRAARTAGRARGRA